VTPENHDGLLVQPGTTQCLGNLFVVQEGVFDPELGRIDTTHEEAERHNGILDQALIEGLDTCEIGDEGAFYLEGKPGNFRVTTWLGNVVSDDVTLTRQMVTFRRNGKVFQGKLIEDGNLFLFKRIK
jgi:hypothetical protein